MELDSVLSGEKLGEQNAILFRVTLLKMAASNQDEACSTCLVLLGSL